MDEQNVISRMQAVTISREYGSGGGEIAKRLAQHLGWQLIDHEIVAHVAQALEISEEEAEIHDERVESVVNNLLTSMSIVQPAMFSVAPLPVVMTDPKTYREALNHVIEAAVTRGHVVIVGRGAQVVLAQRRDVLHARIVAPLEQRIAYVMRREGLKRADAQTRIQLKEHDRMRYLQTQYHRRSDDAHLYDVVINTNVLDLDNAVDLLYLALQQKEQRLTIPTGDLGPATGLPRYPGQPGDIRPIEEQ
jgi:cytidylate kinase